MPRVTCSGCSKNLHVDDKYSGRKIKCPVCKAAIDVPAASAATSTPAPVVAQRVNRVVASAVQPPVGQATKIEVQCTCGLTLRTPETNAGKRVQCPKCKAALAVPYPSNPPGESQFGGDHDPFGTNLAPAAFAPAPANSGDFWNTTNYVAPPSQVTNNAQRDRAAASAHLGDLSPHERAAVASAMAVETRHSEGGGNVNYRFVLLAVGLLFFGPVLMLVGCNERSNVAMLQAEGVDTTGIVMEGTESRGRRGRRSYSLEVSYQSETGQSHTKSFSVSQSEFAAHCNSSTIYNPKIAIRYARSDPSIARLAAQSDNSSVTITIGMIMFIIGAVLTGVCAWLFMRNQS